MDAANALELRDVTKRFGDHVAVDRLSLAVPAGCICGVLGPNGAGKTTTLRMVTSILLPDSGSISILGRPDAQLVRDRLGYLPEERGLYKKMRAAEIIAYFGRLKGLSADVARRRARELLVRYGLGDSMGSRCEALSKGMAQKVQILATLVHEPELIILDEPFSGLDPVNTQLLRDLVLDLKRDGRTILFSTHVMEQAEQICDRVVLIDRGRKVLDGTLSEVRRSDEITIRIDYDGDGRRLRGLPGVLDVHDTGKTAELRLDARTDPQAVLRSLTGVLTIRRFDLSERSLHDIFVRTVSGAGA